MDLEFLLPSNRLVTLDNTGKVAQIYLEGQEKTHIVEQALENKVTLKSLNSPKKFRELFTLDIHYLTPNETGGYNSNIYSHRYGC